MSDAARAYADAGAAHIAAGNYLAAQESYEQALLLNADAPILHYGHGLALQKSRQYEAAIAAYDKVIALYPTMAYAHLAKAHCALILGDFARGWPAYEWRIQFDETPPNPYYKFSPPTWTLETIKGKQILLWSEQGFGDMLQFCRYIPLIAQSAAKVHWVVHPLLRRLFEQSFSLPNVIITSTTNPTPEHDAHCSVMSLPLICGTDTIEKIPAQSYLVADPTKLAAWQKRIATLPACRLRVGLVWSGSRPQNNLEASHINQQRLINPHALARLSGIPGVQFFSLQKDEYPEQAITPSFELWNWTRDLHDWADTAALIAHLDLIISVDTGVVHLAGALGKPVWILSRYEGCWRWLENRDDSPWYPSARLFRQNKTGDWNEVIDRVSATLKELL